MTAVDTAITAEIVANPAVAAAAEIATRIIFG
jgi:hypothetical protein